MKLPDLRQLHRYGPALALMLAAGTSVAAEQPSNERLQQGWMVYNRTCTVCHMPGVGGAPRVGDRQAWKDRIDGGTDLLYRHAIKGWTGDSGKRMPARGGNWNLTDEQVEAAVDYMVQYSQ